ncbi:MAG TPA: hypothetical protein VFR55_05720 [Dehalococcoidia bacterium]|nr:hypothetical protein [Dehalococcoidia bacterium]
MISRYRGRVGEYMWEKEMERLQRYNDRPWERQSKDTNGGAFLAMMFVLAVALGVMTLMSLL